MLTANKVYCMLYEVNRYLIGKLSVAYTALALFVQLLLRALFCTKGGTACSKLRALQSSIVHVATGKFFGTLSGGIDSIYSIAASAIE